MKLDKEQKRILKAVLPVCGGYWIGYPLVMWLFGKLDSWKDLLVYFGAGLVITLLMTLFYVLGSRIPRKDKFNGE